jgi:hypothetical protein
MISKGDGLKKERKIRTKTFLIPTTKMKVIELTPHRMRKKNNISAHTYCTSSGILSNLTEYNELQQKKDYLNIGTLICT